MLVVPYLAAGLFNRVFPKGTPEEEAKLQKEHPVRYWAAKASRAAGLDTREFWQKEEAALTGQPVIADSIGKGK